MCLTDSDNVLSKYQIKIILKLCLSFSHFLWLVSSFVCLSMIYDKIIVSPLDFYKKVYVLRDKKDSSMFTFSIDMHVSLFSFWREYLVKDREGIAIIGENAEYLNGTYHIQIQENTERTMSLRVENHTPEVVQLLHCEMLKRMRVFKLDDAKKMTEGRQAVSINSGRFPLVNVRSWHYV